MAAHQTQDFPFQKRLPPYLLLLGLQDILAGRSFPGAAEHGIPETGRMAIPPLAALGWAR